MRAMEGCCEVPDDAIAVAPGIAGITVVKDMRCGCPEIPGSDHHRRHRAAAARLDTPGFQVVHELHLVKPSDGVDDDPVQIVCGLVTVIM
jgi:hypothetical protein